MGLSLRLETIASFVPRCRCVADVGTDHGYIPIRLVEDGTAGAAIAMDVREGPLRRAAGHIRERGLEGRIELRLSDGLEKLEPGDADVVVISGMGGELMRRILEEGRRGWEAVGVWVLSPQSEWGAFRRYLIGSGFGIRREEMVEEDGKYYLVMEASHRGSQTGRIYGGSGAGACEGWTDAEYLYGKKLIAERNPVLRTYLEKELRQKTALVGQLAKEGGDGAVRRFKQVREEMRVIEEVLNGM